jgi:DNA repair protein RecO (recombination protein O)
MGIVRTEGIVLRTYAFSETSRIVHAFTLHYGIQSLLARGARRPRSRFGGGLETFTRLDLVYYRKREGMMHTLSECSVIDSHPALSSDLEKFYGGSVVLEVVKRFATEEEPNRELYVLIVDSLLRLGAALPGMVEIELLAFLWRFIGRLGFRPDLGTCSSCGSPIERVAALAGGGRAVGALCPGCSSAEPGAFELGEGHDRILDLLGGKDIPGAIPGDARLMRNLWSFTTAYISLHFHDERSIASLQSFLSLLESGGPDGGHLSGTGDRRHREGSA